MPTRNPRGRPAHPDLLTPAEWRVAEAIRHGLSNPAIARLLGVSTEAVKFHAANCLQKLGLTRRAELRRWNGVRRDSALFAQETTTNTDLTLGPIGQIARSVRDIAAARHWYGEVLGLTPLFDFGKMAFFACGELRLLLQEDDDDDAASILYFRVDDIRAAHAALSARGVVFINAPHMIHRQADGTEEWMAFLSDNEDRPLAIMAQVKV